MTASVLVLNASHEPLQKVSLTHAVRMLIRNVAVVAEPDGEAMIGPYQRPRVVRLLRYVYAKWRYHQPRWSRRGVLRRDHHQCAYCGRTATTVDHVTPTSRGGKNTWLNTVACCIGCNARKGNQLLEEVGMRLRFEPHVPRWDELHARAA